MMKRLLLASVFALMSHAVLADVTIDALSAATALGGTEAVPIFQTANPAVRTTPSAIRVYIAGTASTWSAAQTYNNSMFIMVGSSTGFTTLTSANAGASNFTLTLPAITDTLVTLTATQTLTNKTLTAPTMTAPVLGTPASGSAVNLTNIPVSQATGVLPAANGGAGTINGALKGNGSGTVSQAACADLSNATAACSTAIGTSGATIPLLSTANTWASGQVFVAPVLGTPASGSGVNLTNIPTTALTGTVTDPSCATWDSTTAVTAQTIDFPVAWATYTITSVKAKVAGGGSFTYAIKIGGTGVTSCNVVTVNSSSNVNTSCTGANTGSANDIISIVIASPSGTVNQAYVCPVFTHTVN